jgi:TPR repeat protein
VRTAFFFFGLPTALLLVTATLCAQQPNPPLAELKAAAEAGDAQAQDKLGDIYFKGGNFEDAVTWYRRAAPHSILNSQYQLAHILLMWASSPSVSKTTSAMHSDEALPWLLKAASRRHNRAQLELGQLYRDGRLLKTDLPEAYKWYCLAAEGSSTELFAPNLGISYRDGLILKMSQEQISEGDRRVAHFLAEPAKAAPMPEPSYFQQLKLQGITGTPGQQLAIINGKTLSANDTATFKIDGHSVTFRCLTIAPISAIIAIDGFLAPKELLLH